MSQEQLMRNEAEACGQGERGAIKDDPILNQVVGKCKHDKLCDTVTEQMQLRDELKDDLASLSVAAAKDNKCKRS